MPGRIRVYVPATVASLDRLVAEGSLGPAPLPAYAVTDDLVAWWREGAPDRPDDEDLEYAATLQAAAASLAMLDADDVLAGSSPARRVVLAADVTAVSATGADDDAAPGAVTVPDVLDFAAVASVHVDAPDAAASVREAVAALADDEAPASHVELVLTELVDHDLAWYSPQEAADLVEQLLSGCPS